MGGRKSLPGRGNDQCKGPEVAVPEKRRAGESQRSDIRARAR